MRQIILAILILIVYLVGFIQHTFFNVWNTVYRLIRLQNPHFIYAFDIQFDSDSVQETTYSFCFTKRGIVKFINVKNHPYV